MLGYTIKPNIYGSLACHVLGIPTINNISGLGAVFISRGWVTHLVQFLYRQALARSAHVFFQNSDDEALFLSRGLAPRGGRACCRALGSIWCGLHPWFRLRPWLGLRQSWPSGIHSRVPSTNNLPELSGFC